MSAHWKANHKIGNFHEVVGQAVSLASNQQSRGPSTMQCRNFSGTTDVAP